MRNEGRVVPVTDRLCMTPIHKAARRFVAEKGIRAVLKDLSKPAEGTSMSPLLRGLMKIRSRYEVTGTPISPVGQKLRNIATSATAVKALVLYEGVAQKVKEKVGAKLPHTENIAGIAVMLTAGVFGAETSSSSGGGTEGQTLFEQHQALYREKIKQINALMPEYMSAVLQKNNVRADELERQLNALREQKEHYREGVITHNPYATYENEKTYGLSQDEYNRYKDAGDDPKDWPANQDMYDHD